ncbi:hypothetical protein RND71_035924 [Anisodus tanguticus]|uniref:CHY-type domain-containing protein n=1 Tax=Anisodus tanguticus TaxID=243964 RepID=A0AAE1R644_9SOLA|nr:hypothetical protein RND71_035924 [Anisodus tanguticus]
MLACRLVMRAMIKIRKVPCFLCSHYRRRCKIRAPICDEIFDCRHCHNDSKNCLEVDPLKRLDVPRHDIKKFFWVKLRRSFAHYVTQNKMFNKHAFIVGFVWGSTIAQNATFLMTTFPRINTTLINVESADGTAFPLLLSCLFKIILRYVPCLGKLDQEVATTPMPEMYQNKMVWIICNECGQTSEVNFHIVAHKCPNSIPESISGEPCHLVRNTGDSLVNLLALFCPTTTITTPQFQKSWEVEVHCELALLYDGILLLYENVEGSLLVFTGRVKLINSHFSVLVLKDSHCH